MVQPVQVSQWWIVNGFSHTAEHRTFFWPVPDLCQSTIFKVFLEIYLFR